jgi:hypothetical protein
MLIHYDDLSPDLSGQMRRIAGRLGNTVLRTCGLLLLKPRPSANAGQRRSGRRDGRNPSESTANPALDLCRARANHDRVGSIPPSGPNRRFRCRSPS